MTQPSNPQGISHLRCSDEDRELVAQVLNNAYADGRLDFDEHSERIATAYNAKTFGELDVLTLDLIPPATRPAPQAPRALAATSGHEVLASTNSFTGGRAVLASFRPGGPLVIPPYSEVTAVLGDARLDLVGATFLTNEVTIRVNAVLGDVRIRIPEGVRVVSNVSGILGDYKAEGMAGEARVTLTIEGTSFLSDVKVLGPDCRQRKYEKFV